MEKVSGVTIRWVLVWVRMGTVRYGFERVEGGLERGGM